MKRTALQLRDDALRIWRAGVAAVQPARLVREFVGVKDGELWIGDEPTPLTEIRRIVIIGGGKASASMAAALEQALGPEVLQSKQVAGWVNVPAGAGANTRRTRIHEARPAGRNEPTEAAAAGVNEMLRLVSELTPQDLCFCVLSGGGSALLPAPLTGLSLTDKATITRELSARGASIHEINAVRRELSIVKGGGLARACKAGRLVSLILSDVPGDDLATIASGVTVEGPPAKREAIKALHDFDLISMPEGRRALELLQQKSEARTALRATCRVTNLVIGNNATAVDGAGIEAERLGYSHAMTSANVPEGPVEDVARQLASMADRMRSTSGPDCLISGGEPTVCLAPAAERGRGGRNQQLCLAALAELRDWRGLALVSGGTDGEDGPTDAAGAWVDEHVAAEAACQGLDVTGALRRNDAYSFFASAGGLLKTGPTHTNVCDLRIVTVSQS